AGWTPNSRVHIPLATPEPPPSVPDLGPRVSEFVLPAVTLPQGASVEEARHALGNEPSITSIVLGDEYQRPTGVVDRTRFLLTMAGPYGHALHARKPATVLADAPRVVPRTVPAIAAMQVAGREKDRVFDDLVVVDEVGRCMGVLHVSDLIQH